MVTMVQSRGLTELGVVASRQLSEKAAQNCVFHLQHAVNIKMINGRENSVIILSDRLISHSKCI